jgi:protein-disulfide isomerase
MAFTLAQAASYIEKQPYRDDVVAKVNGVEVKRSDLYREDELFDAQMKAFDMKIGYLQNMVLNIYGKREADKKGISITQYMQQYVDGNVAVSEQEIDAFIRAQNIPANVGRDRIRGFLEGQNRQSARADWVKQITEKEPIEIYFNKPRRPRVKVDAGDSPWVGGKNAPVEIIVFTDYQCPFCGRFDATLEQVKKAYGDKVRIVYKNTPLPFHKEGPKAAEAALCAYDQGKSPFERYNIKLYEAAAQKKLSVSNYKAIAKATGLDTNAFNQCLDTSKMAGKVKADMAYGDQIGVRSTPTSFINGLRISGALPFEQYKVTIDEELVK